MCGGGGGGREGGEENPINLYCKLPPLSLNFCFCLIVPVFFNRAQTAFQSGWLSIIFFFFTIFTSKLFYKLPAVIYNIIFQFILFLNFNVKWKQLCNVL